MTLKMITIIFIDGEGEYDNYIVNWFSLLKEHVTMYGCDKKICMRDLSMLIQKSSFDFIVAMKRRDVRDRVSYVNHGRTPISSQI